MNILQSRPCISSSCGEFILCAEWRTWTADVFETARSAMLTMHAQQCAGLVDGILGASVGEERSVPITLPDTWEPEQLRGVRADCSVKVKEIFEWELPEVTHVVRK